MLMRHLQADTGPFSSLGATTHQLTRKAWVWRGFILPYRMFEPFLNSSGRELQSQTPSLPRRSLCRQEKLRKQQQQKALWRAFLIMSLSKYLIIVENKLHVTEIILWRIVNLLGSCFWVPVSVLWLLEQRLLPPGHFITASYLNANCWRQVHSTGLGLATVGVMFAGRCRFSRSSR